MALYKPSYGTYSKNIILYMSPLKLVRAIPSSKMAFDYYHTNNICGIDGIAYLEDDESVSLIACVKFLDGVTEYFLDLILYKHSFEFEYS